MIDNNPFDSLSKFETNDGTLSNYVSLQRLQDLGHCNLEKLPFTIRILLESALRKCDGFLIKKEDVIRIASWSPDMIPEEIPFSPSRVLLQDFTGVPAVVDLAAMRDGIMKLGGDPQKINPLNPVDLVIDHSVMIDEFGNQRAFRTNVDREYERNMERYSFLKYRP